MDFIRELGTLALGSRLRRLSDQMMASGAEIYRTSELDFEPRWFPLFRLLVDRESASVGEAADALGLTHAAVSQTARAMIKRGILESTKDPGDERRRVLTITEEGRALVPDLELIWADFHAAIDEMVSFAGIDILAALEGLEQAQADRSMYERVVDRRRERLRREVEYRRIGPAERSELTPELAQGFADVNYEWLEKDFTVEQVDRDVLSRPEVILEDGGDIFFASVAGKVVGACALWPASDDPSSEERGVELTKMGVLEAYQGRGIGRRLMELALEWARDLGVGRVFLMTNTKLSPALALYRKAGFRVVRSGPHPKYDRCDLLMEIQVGATE